MCPHIRRALPTTQGFLNLEFLWSLVYDLAFNLTIKAWHTDSGPSREVIGIFIQSINFLADKDWQRVIKSGQNGIGLLNCSYCIQQLEDNNTNKCNNEISAVNGTGQQVTSSPADPSYTWTDNSIISKSTSFLHHLGHESQWPFCSCYSPSSSSPLVLLCYASSRNGRGNEER